ncbi:MAG: acetamidase/formamidase family protein [Bryobacterales bacterium]|nr:acetamidase/formamidase family protein [Bryobacterales bacterium]
MRAFAAIAAFIPVALTAETHTVVGTEYYHTYSRSHPVLKRVKPGDRIVTKTVDSAGFDLKGVRHTKTHGNPQTGAFYIEGAAPGDTLVVRIDKLALNRDYGYTGVNIATTNALPQEFKVPKPGMDVLYKGYDYLEPWAIDLVKREVYPKRTPSLRFPAQPMLGCIGVAPEGDYAPRSGPSGYWGGNMDYNFIREGATVYLPVFHEGGLLFFGDGHALQGDGELLGAGVETSLDVEVTVNVKKGYRIERPRAETKDWIIAIGAKEKSTMEERTQLANEDLLKWLVADYRLAVPEAHFLLGMKVRLDILSMAGATAARIEKSAIPRH